MTGMLWRPGMIVSLTALVALAYAPFLPLPFISDSYLQVALARDYGGELGWNAMWRDPLYRCRATSLWLTWVLDRAFGADPVMFHVTAQAIHVVNALLIAGLGAWRRIGHGVAIPAAVFFAVHEGHQEAVVWFAAVPELLVFFFGMLSLLAWIRWLQEERKPEPGAQDAASLLRWCALPALSLGFYTAALFSKESAVVVPVLWAAVAWVERAPWRRWAPAAALGALMACAYTVPILLSRAEHLHLNDGTFSLQAPFWRTMLMSAGRLFWFWGLLALAAGFASRSRVFRWLAAGAAFWVAVTLLPYSFLTYMPRVPSRHTYWASAGLAVVVGAALWAWQNRLEGRVRRWVTALAAVAVIAHNAGYLWLRKTRQFHERAAATEELIQFASQQRGPIHVDCFPYGAEISISTLRVVYGRDRSGISVSPERPIDGAAVFCAGYCRVARSFSSRSARSPDSRNSLR